MCTGPWMQCQTWSPTIPFFFLFFSDFFAILLLFFIQHSPTLNIWKCRLDPENSAHHRHQQWAPLLSSLMHPMLLPHHLGNLSDIRCFLDKFPFWRLQIAALTVNISAEAGEGEKITHNFFRIRTPDTLVTVEQKIHMWHKRDIFGTREKIFWCDSGQKIIHDRKKIHGSGKIFLYSRSQKIHPPSNS